MNNKHNNSDQAAITKVGQLELTDHFDHCILGKIPDVELKNQITAFKKSLSQFIK